MGGIVRDAGISIEHFKSCCNVKCPNFAHFVDSHFVCTAFNFG